MTRLRTGVIAVAVSAPLLALVTACSTTPQLTVTSVQLRPDGASTSVGETTSREPFILPAGVPGLIEVFFTINVRDHTRCVLDLDGSHAVTPVEVGAGTWEGKQVVSFRTSGLVLDRAVTGSLRCGEAQEVFGRTTPSDDFSVATRLEIVSSVMSPSEMSYGSVQVGSRSAGQEVLVGSFGSLSATVASVRLTGPGSTSFATSRDTCTGATLGRYMSCSLDVSFVPTSEGPQSALVEIALTSADPAHPDSVTLLVRVSGTGTPAPPPPPPPQDDPHHPPTG